MLTVIMLSFIFAACSAFIVMLGVNMLNVIMLSVVAPFKTGPLGAKSHAPIFTQKKLFWGKQS